MFDIAILDEPAEKKNHYANREQTRSNEVCEPLSAQVVSPRIALIELFALILFLTIAVLGVARNVRTMLLHGLKPVGS